MVFFKSFAFPPDVIFKSGKSSLSGEATLFTRGIYLEKVFSWHFFPADISQHWACCSCSWSLQTADGWDALATGTRATPGVPGFWKCLGSWVSFNSWEPNQMIVSGFRGKERTMLSDSVLWWLVQSINEKRIATWMLGGVGGGVKNSGRHFSQKV